MARVTELGYLGITVSNVAEWKEFAMEIMGLECFSEPDVPGFFMRVDDWHHRIKVSEGDADDCIFYGFRVKGQPELQAMFETLIAAGFAPEMGSRELADERHVLGLFSVQDPAGNQLEIFYGPEIEAQKPFHPGRPLFGKFKTGSHGMGHVLLKQNDNEEGLAFYRLLGMTGDVEYRMLIGDMCADAVFLSANGRQHTVAFAAGPADKSINHLMLEYTDVRDLGMAYDKAKQRAIPLPMDLGMHTNDGALSFYMVTPSGWAVELGWTPVECASEQQEYYRRDVFGHASFGLDDSVLSRNVSDI